MVVSVGHVELTRSELRVVSHIDAFVSELTTDLVHSVYPSDHEHLSGKRGTSLADFSYKVHYIHFGSIRFKPKLRCNLDRNFIYYYYYYY